MQTAGHLVAAVAELAAGVQHGEGERDGRDLLRRVLLDRDAAAVVGDPDAAVGQQPYVDGVAEAGHRLVDGVVDDLGHQVVQTALPGGADVHPGALADRFQALQHGDGLGVVLRGPGAVAVVHSRQRVERRGSRPRGRPPDRWCRRVSGGVVGDGSGNSSVTGSDLLSHRRRPRQHPDSGARGGHDNTGTAVIGGIRSRPERGPVYRVSVDRTRIRQGSKRPEMVLGAPQRPIAPNGRGFWSTDTHPRRC